MNTVSEEITHLVNQVQIAHRLCVGFYQRLLPCVQQVASALECSFCSWNPLETDRPTRQYTPPQNKWAWDMVPMYATEHLYERVAGEHAREGDLNLSFHIYLDQNFKSDQRKQLGIKGQPDPLTLPQGEANVEICMYRCTADSKTSFDSLWEAAKEPDAETAGWQMVGEKMQATSRRYPLARFIAQTDQVIAELEVMLDVPVEADT